MSESLPGVYAVDPDDWSLAGNLAHQYNLKLVRGAAPDDICALDVSAGRLSLSASGQRLCVDFVSGALAHRRKYGGGKGQDIAKAVGLNKRKSLSVLDATAGLGRDAFVLATLGCQVQMWERNPVVHALLADGIRRGLQDPETAPVLSRMLLFLGSACSASQSHPVDVVYLDPMFPEKRKSAKPKKDMQIFHSLVGADCDNEGLLTWAREKAVYRVVVKRPRIAECLCGAEPTYSLSGKSNRFDVYVNQSLDSLASQ